MKKTLIALAFAGLATVSCGSSGWKCTNRYCKSPEKEQSKQTPANPKTKPVNT